MISKKVSAGVWALRRIKNVVPVACLQKVYKGQVQAFLILFPFLGHLRQIIERYRKILKISPSIYKPFQI